MKRRIYLLVLLLPAYLLMSYSSGADAGYSGSLGDNGRTCTFCHSHNGVSYSPTITVTGIPASGYVPGQTYQIAISVTNANNAKNGFEACIEDTSNQKQGSFANVDNNTQAIQNNTYVTHTSAGTNNSNWQFTWTAPANPQGDLNLYYAINLADGNGQSTNDYVESGSANIPVDPAFKINEFTNAELMIYPNPVADFLTVKSEKYHFEQARITDMSGKTYPVTIINNRIDVSHLSAGNYFLYLQNEQIKGVKQFVKK